MQAKVPAHLFLRSLHALAEHSSDPIELRFEHEAKPQRIRMTTIVGAMPGSVSPAPLDGAAWVTATVDARILGAPPATPSAFFHRLAHVMPPVAAAGELEINLSRLEEVEGRSRALDRLAFSMDTYQLTARSAPKALTEPGPEVQRSAMKPCLPSSAHRLASAIGRAADWCYGEDDRFHLTGVLLEADGDETTAVVGCDGHRLLVQRVKAPWPFGPVSIHRRVAKALAAFLPDAEVTMGLITPNASERRPPSGPNEGPRCQPAYLLMDIKSPLHGDLSLVIRTLDITYPPWRLVATLPVEREHRAYTIGTARLRRATALGPIIESRIAHMPRGGKLHEVGEDLLLTMFLVNEHEEQDNAVTDSLGRFGVRGLGPIGLDPSYLHKACEALGDPSTGPGTVSLLLGGPLDPIMLDGVRYEGLEPGAAETHVRVVIMPRRL